MPSFSHKSAAHLATCHNDLKALFNEVIKYHDCTITCGFRGRAEQEEAFKKGASKVHFPYGNHNRMPSDAVDVYPYPVDVTDEGRFKEFAQNVKVIRDRLVKEGKIKSKIEWGYDLWKWDMPHWERRKE